ncbi:ATP-binding cassette domain-containing protein [Brucella sp. C7-11G]
MTILHVESLERRYGERRIGPVDFSLEQGEIGLITGRSGSGKSTMLDLIYGTRVATSGKITLRLGDRECDLLSLSVPELVAVRHAAIGYCTQFLSTIPGKSGLELAREAARPGTESGEIERLLERLALPGLIWNQPVSMWSGGEKQRFNMALAALRKPSLILLDEPLAALDPTLHPIILDFLSELSGEGVTLLVGLHQTLDGFPVAKHLVCLPQPEA